MRPESGVAWRAVLVLGLAVLFAGAANPAPARPIRIGVESSTPPLSTLDGKGRPTGFSADLIQAMAAAEGLELVVVPGYWGDISRQFREGKLDALANVLINEERGKTMEFSVSHATLHGLIYTRPNGPAITQTSEFAGKTAAVVRGAVSHTTIRNHPEWGVRLLEMGSRPDTLQAVKDGRADFALHILASSMPISDDLGLRNDYVRDLTYAFHFAVHKGDAETLARLNQALATVIHNGTFDRIYSRWIGPIEPHPIQLADLRPYRVPAILGLAAVVLMFAWLRQTNRQLERQAAELRKGEERLRRTGELAKVGGWELDAHTRKLTWTPQTFRIHDWNQPTEPTFEEFVALYPREARPQITAAVEAALERGEPFDLEVPLVNPPERALWVRIQGFAHRQDGRIESLDGSVQDITVHKQAEASLETMTERLVLALEASKLGVWRHHLESGANEWDPRMFAIFGLPVRPEAPRLDAMLERVAAEDRAAVRAAWAALSGGEASHQVRFRVAHPDGQVRQVELHGVIHRDRQGRPAWIIGVAGDITEIVEATSESERLRVQLQQSQRMEALGSLAAGVAHDFNNLLTGINGFVELASTSLPAGHEALTLLQQARSGAMSARDLVRRILDFSRGEGTHGKILTDVLQVIRDTVPIVVAGLPANVTLSLDLRCDAAPVVADASQLQQVLLNLCTNAAHAIGDRTGRIRISAEVVEDAPAALPVGKSLRLLVSDTGSGMDEATRRRVFEPFFTTKRKGEGTGLGLSIVQEIIANHEGVVDLESEVGVGTTFRIHLPLAPGMTDVPAPVETAPTVAGQGQRVLVVDDEASIATVARLALKKWGYEPEVFTSPRRAWERFERDPRAFDLLIVDCDMPDISGPELVTRILERTPELPVIMMSGRFGRQMDFERLRIERLKKPFEMAELRQIVSVALGRTTAS
ncbi:MAG TPA: transporter substrate-binding domain-containing protein [Opitutaceae bacterium]|nr:transporter substrate-binding domain-containing protein [Opitutaceae bacterium]